MPELLEEGVPRLAASADPSSRRPEGRQRGEVQSPPRPEITVPGKGFLLSMPAWHTGGLIGVKQVSVFDGNLELGLPNHLALITLYEPETGKPVCVMEARTSRARGPRAPRCERRPARARRRPHGDDRRRRCSGARAPVAAAARARAADDPDRVAARRGRTRSCRPGPAGRGRWRRRSRGRRRTLGHRLSRVAQPRPVIDAAWVPAGAHVTSVGYAPPAGELPPALAQAPARLFVEDACAFEPPPVGCSELAGIDPSTATTLGEVIVGSSPGRVSRDEITVYKAMGVAIEDLVAAELAYRTALARGLGQTVAI